MTPRSLLCKHPSRHRRSHTWPTMMLTVQPQIQRCVRWGETEKTWPAPTWTHKHTQIELCTSSTTIPSLLTHICRAHSLAELTKGNSLHANFTQRGAATLPAISASLFSLVTVLAVKSSNLCVEMIWQ